MATRTGASEKLLARPGVRFGIFLALTNSAIGAAQPVLTRYGALRVDPILFCEGSVVVASLCSLVLLYFRNELKYLFDPRYAGQLFLMGFSGTVVTSLTLIYGLKQIDAVACVILLQTEPVYSLLLSALVLGERPGKRQILATATILAGLGSVFWAGTGAFSPLFAAFLIFVTPLFWQSAHVIGLEIMPPLTPVCITAGRFVYAALVITPLFLLFDRSALFELADPRAAGVIALTGFFVYFLSALTWYSAIRRLSLSWTTTLVVPGAPLLGIAMAVALLGERPSPITLGGALIAICGVLILVLGTEAHRKPSARVTAYAVGVESNGQD